MDPLRPGLLVLELSHFVCQVKVRKFGNHRSVIRDKWNLSVACLSFEESSKHDRFIVFCIFRGVDQSDPECFCAASTVSAIAFFSIGFLSSSL